MTDPRGTARVHVGPLYATPGLTVQEFGVDTNVFNNADENSDFTFTVVPRATVWVPFARRALVTTNVGTDVVYFQKYDSERSINPQVKLRGEGSLGRIMPFAEGSYLNTRQRPNFEIDARLRRTEGGVKLGASVRLSEKIYAEIAGSQADVNFAADAVFNDTNMREVLNRTTRSAQLSVRYEETPLTTFVVRAETASDRFEFSPIRNSSTVRVMPGVEFKPRALVSGSAYVGVRRLSSDSGSIPGFNGVVTSATLNYTLKGSTRFTVTADRDLTYSFERVQPYYIAGGYGLTVRRQIVGRTDITGGVLRQSYSYRDLLDATVAQPTPVHRLDLTRTWSATVGYRFGQSTRLGFGAYYRRRESNSIGYRDYQGFRFITTLDYGL
jgi:Putative beta-barrel porin 2